MIENYKNVEFIKQVQIYCDICADTNHILCLSQCFLTMNVDQSDGFTPFEENLSGCLGRIAGLPSTKPSHPMPEEPFEMKSEALGPVPMTDISVGDQIDIKLTEEDLDFLKSM